jgi:hypothetical protein
MYQHGLDEENIIECHYEVNKWGVNKVCFTDINDHRWHLLLTDSSAELEYQRLYHKMISRVQTQHPFEQGGKIVEGMIKDDLHTEELIRVPVNETILNNKQQKEIDDRLINIAYINQDAFTDNLLQLKKLQKDNIVNKSQIPFNQLQLRLKDFMANQSHKRSDIEVYIQSGKNRV